MAACLVYGFENTTKPYIVAQASFTQTKEIAVPVRFQELSRDARDGLHGIAISMYLDGQCYELAAAISRYTGCPMMGIIENGVIRHAVAQIAPGIYYDARGEVTRERLGEPFGIAPPCELRKVTLEDLRAVRDVPERRIRTAAKIAQTLWPLLPWNANSHIHRVRAFAEGLENLSRTFDLWIVGPVPNPASWPLVSIGAEEDDGYVLVSNEDGMGYRITRRFKNE